MLLYAAYYPKKESSWDRPRVYGFASVERFVAAMESVNKGRSGRLEPITHETAARATSIATFFTGVDKNGAPTKDGSTLWVGENAIRSTWDGSMMEVHLVENIADERIPGNMVYP